MRWGIAFSRSDSFDEGLSTSGFDKQQKRDLVESDELKYLVSIAHNADRPMQQISIKSVKNCKLSDDGSAVILTMVTKYSGELDFSLPVACREELVALLNGTVPTALQPQVSAPVVAAPAPQSPPHVNAPAAAQPPQPKQSQLTVNVPKQWAVTADVKLHQLVVLIFDPQTERQAGYALSEDAAQEMGAQLGKAAMEVRAHKARKQAKPN